jgi:arylsulfatase
MKCISAATIVVLLAVAPDTEAGDIREADTRAPNIIVILTDDQGYGDLSCQGATDLHTPHIDRMAAEGIRLTSFYTAPVCSPARAMLMTGGNGAPWRRGSRA